MFAHNAKIFAKGSSRLPVDSRIRDLEENKTLYERNDINLESSLSSPRIDTHIFPWLGEKISPHHEHEHAGHYGKIRSTREARRSAERGEKEKLYKRRFEMRTEFEREDIAQRVVQLEGEYVYFMYNHFPGKYAQNAFLLDICK